MTASLQQVKCALQYGLENWRLLLGSRKVCTSWVLKMLTIKLKTAQIYVCAEFLHCIEKVVDAFL
jgi:hypothetical protein